MLFGYKPGWVGWLLAAAASGLPDMDLPPAKIGRLFWFLSRPLERRFGHRTLTHSLVALVAVMAVSGPLIAIDARYFWAVVGGYGSHLWIDMLNIRGVDLFWPSPVRLVTPGNRNGRLEVGSQGERIPAQSRRFYKAAWIRLLLPCTRIGNNSRRTNDDRSCSQLARSGRSVKLRKFR
jgi:inner membrane protein